MSGKELERTRIYQMSDFPPGTRMLVGDRRDLDEALASGTVRAVGRYSEESGGAVSIPVVYVSKRAQPILRRYRWWFVGAGSLASLASIIAWAILSIGLWGFVGLVFAIAAGIIFLNRMASGGGRHRVSVTTTTTTNVRVR